jgi:hypothetical protein
MLNPDASVRLLAWQEKREIAGDIPKTLRNESILSDTVSPSRVKYRLR